MKRISPKTYSAPRYSPGVHSTNLLKARLNILVCPFAHDELAVVKVAAIVEKQLYGRRHDGIAVMVSAVIYLIVYLPHAVNNGATFLQRKMQGLADIV